MKNILNKRALIRHQCKKTTVLSSHRCLNSSGVEKMNKILNIDQNFDHQMYLSKMKYWYSNNRTTHIRHQCKKTIVLICHRCLNNSGVEKMNKILNIDQNFDHQMSLSKMRYWYSNNRTAHIRHQCKKTTVLICHRCLINTCVEEMNNFKQIRTLTPRCL